MDRRPGRRPSPHGNPAARLAAIHIAPGSTNLKGALWECAEVLRGTAVDRTDWKAYILPLLFFKRMSDVWDEETADAVETYGDTDPVDYPEIHRFDIPPGCHWRD